jgi:hypothetical protein
VGRRFFWLVSWIAAACAEPRAHDDSGAVPWDGPADASTYASTSPSGSTSAGEPADTTDDGAVPPSETSSSTGAGEGEPAGLGIAGNRFTLDGEERFVLGISYFSCLYAPDAVLDHDFAVFAERGFSLVRCWVNWPIHFDTWDTESADNFVLVRADGSLDPDALAKLESIIALARDHGIVVDMTFNQDTPTKTFAAHEAGIVAAAGALVGTTSVLFDMQNETDHNNQLPDLFMNETQALDARNAVDAVDPLRLLAASTSKTTTLASYTLGAELDIGAYHCCRNVGTITDWAAATSEAVANTRAVLGDGVPIYMQEPNRCGTGDQYATCDGDGSEFVTAAVNAKTAGAAGWVFHTTASYDLRAQSLEAQLQPTEVDALVRLADALADAPWG